MPSTPSTLVVFEVHLATGSDPSSILSKEILNETQAQIMTLDEAKAVGFAGLPEAPAGADVRLIACAKNHEKWIRDRIERSEAVGGYRIHEVG